MRLDNPILSQRFEEALIYGARLHALQGKKGTDVPYIAHLLGVASLVLDDGGDEDEAIAALLHDAVEDQGGRNTLEEIRIKFGDKVARIVEGCTDAYTNPKPPWRPRKERYIEHLRHAPPEVLHVSLADKLYNARSIVADIRRHGITLESRFNRPKEQTLWYYCSLAELYLQKRPGWMAEELNRVVEEMIRLAAR